MKAQLQDYYKILEVPAAATLPEIKKAYRRLAFKYHPDTNNSQFAEVRFREIQEAYETLSHTDKRRHYDEERWLAGMGNRARDKEMITPQWILKEAQRLKRHMATVDTYRMSHSALYDYIFLLLSDAHMAILQEDGDLDTNHAIVRELLASTRNLRHQYMQPTGDRLALLATPDNMLIAQIYTQVNQSRRSAAWEKYMPLVIVLVAILLAVAMWWWGR